MGGTNNCVFLFQLDKNSGCYGNIRFHRLRMGKVEIGNFCSLDGYIWKFLLQKCLLRHPLCFICILSKLLPLIGCRGDIKDKFLEKIFKNLRNHIHKGDEADILGTL